LTRSHATTLCNSGTSMPVVFPAFRFLRRIHRCLPTPPRLAAYSTLFPYTTLFRSRKLLLLVNATETLDTESLESYAEWHQDTEIDRKSTRLNSSHRTISYAVFCLKKKKMVKTGR